MDASLSNSIPGIVGRTKEIMYALSTMSYVVVAFGLLAYSVFTFSMGSWGFYMVWMFVSACFRGIVQMYLPPAESSANCGLSPMFSNQTYTFSVFLLAFTCMYIWVPMFATKNVHYGVIGLLGGILGYDLIIKYSTGCVSSTKIVIAELLGGMGLGSLWALIMLSTARKHIYFGDGDSSSSSGTKCSMPSRNTFKCAVYKNGELVTSRFA